MRLRRGMAAVAALALAVWQIPPVNAFRLTMSGYNTLTFRHNSVSGGAAGQTTFTYSNYERQRLFENNAGLNLTLQPFDSNRVLLNANINSNRFSPDRSRYNLEYRGNGLNITAGDINAGLSGNEFAPFHKSLRGLKVDGTWGKLGLSTLLSEERAKVATDVFTGNNSPGPYTLRYSPVVDGTEQVRVDGQRKKFGVDYTIQYDTGILMFQTHDQTTIIPATSTVEVSYEYAGYGSAPGILAGVRAQLPVGNVGQFGVTYISQMSRLDGSGGGTGNRYTDQWIGNNTPMVLYLQYRPVAEILSVMVDGVPQTEGVDYKVQSLDAGVITFLRVVPAPPGSLLDAPANVVVEYRVANTSATPNAQGDKSILGLDGTMKLGSAATLGVQFA
ncbi:MAG: hypothetical protein QHJ73_11870, partial [Armatimonadota bacterium]|nr:hypothetical protein [Armatimonadota bacterium]